VYGEVADLFTYGKAVEPMIVTEAARIIHEFIEDYHEKLKENHLFTRFEMARQQIVLVSALRVQHQRGRGMTDRIMSESHLAGRGDVLHVKPLVTDLRLFIRMYAPHEAREDTVLFPAFRRLVSVNEYDALGEEFEDEEHRRFGEDGFERYVDRVAQLEKNLGIYDLSTFTPEVK
jgi:hemerythrin-like domain-containing protein